MRAKFVTISVASARGVADRWAASYQHEIDGWRTSPLAGGQKPKDIYDALCALGDNPPIAKVAEVIGNKSWSYISCDGCSDHVERAVAIGEYEPKQYCATCIQEAACALLEPFPSCAPGA